MTAMPERVAGAIRTMLHLATNREREGSRRAAVAAFQAMRYEDGTDEDLAIIASRKVGVDAVIVAECWDAMLDAILRT